MYDLIVAGAGPAGILLAWDAARLGLSTAIVEARDEEAIGNDWVVAVETRCFRELGLPFPTEDEIFSANAPFYLLPPSHAPMLGPSPSPCHEIFMGAYTRRLLAHALAAGVTLIPATTVQGPLMDGLRVAGVMTSAGPLEASVTADASGRGAVVRDGLPASLGATPDAVPYVSAYERVYEIDVDRAQRFLTRHGYEPHAVYNVIGLLAGYSTLTFGVDPDKGRAALLVGVVDEGGVPAARAYLDAWAEGVGFVREPIVGGGGDIPIRRSLDRLVYDGLVLLGDAACMVNPQHGSGMASGFHAARMAAPVIAEAVARRTVDTAGLWPYAAAYQRTRGASMAFYGALAAVTKRFTRDQVEGLMASGVIGIEQGITSLDGKSIVPGMAELRAGLQALVTLPGSAPTLVGMIASGLASEAAYRLYPGTYDPARLAGWTSLLEAVGQ